MAFWLYRPVALRIPTSCGLYLLNMEHVRRNAPGDERPSHQTVGAGGPSFHHRCEKRTGSYTRSKWPVMISRRAHRHARAGFCIACHSAFRRSMTVPFSSNSTVIIEPSSIGLVFTSIRSSGNTFSPSGVHSLISCLVNPA